MSRCSVYIPYDEHLVSSLLSGSSEERYGYAVTDQLMSTFDLKGGDEEEAEYAAMLLASVDAWSHHRPRIVFSFSVESAHCFTHDQQAHNGGVRITCCRKELTAFFVDEKNAPAPDDLAGDLDRAWEDNRVQEALIDNAMLWHEQSEFEKFFSPS